MCVICKILFCKSIPYQIEFQRLTFLLLGARVFLCRPGNPLGTQTTLWPDFWWFAIVDSSIAQHNTPTTEHHRTAQKSKKIAEKCLKNAVWTQIRSFWETQRWNLKQIEWRKKRSQGLKDTATSDDRKVCVSELYNKVIWGRVQRFEFKIVEFGTMVLGSQFTSSRSHKLISYAVRSGNFPISPHFPKAKSTDAHQNASVHTAQAYNHPMMFAETRKSWVGHNLRQSTLRPPPLRLG